ncbi:hypothetical protein ONZ43_g970 [Nemania bipapillata]|uniref:Uncharacterized protein n=1 Tax=Nemania bipapillata TaxID=110536 RepID=A0ACC2J6C2_9PEZI|nr:hypothetical protein ONZ43_g970 [Nemania bipapillata]
MADNNEDEERLNPNPNTNTSSYPSAQQEVSNMDDIFKMSAPVPANFDAENADNLEDLTGLATADRKAVRSQRFVPSLASLACLLYKRSYLLLNPSAILKVNIIITAVQHLETYWAILQKVKGSLLRLTKIDNDILEHLKTDFPEFDPAAAIDEDEMKSKTGKERWRKFMMAYEKKVDDYNFGTMLRTSPKVEYDQDTTIFVPRMQFYAVEIARNRAGLNDWIYEKAQAEKTK